MVSENETAPADYQRQKSDVDLILFAGEVSQRQKALITQGVPLPMEQIQYHHLVGLLEMFVGPEDSMLVREWHLTWVDRQLDAVEAEMRAQLIRSGIFDDGADLPGFP